MPFQRILESLVRSVAGARGAVFVDRDGDPVAFVGADRPGGEDEIQLEGAELGLLLSRVETIGRAAGLGESRAMHVRTEHGLLLLQSIDDEYFLLLSAAPSTATGTARARLAAAAAEMRAHL